MFIKEKKMKTLLVILMLGAGLNAYAAGRLALRNFSTAELAVECFPSKSGCNGIGVNRGWCQCKESDTYMYFGRVGMPQDELSYLIPHTTFTATYNEGIYTGLHMLGNGNVWKVQQDSSDTGSDDEICGVGGTPINLVACSFGI